MKQSAIWLESEGDAFYRRNKDKSRYPDPVMEAIEANGIKPGETLEVGCGTGWRLRDLHSKFDCLCFGVDASEGAVKDANKHQTPDVFIFQGVATDIQGPDRFDLIIFGFVLYQIDREDLFSIVTKTDWALRNGGHIIIHDFYSEEAKIIPYHHDQRLKTFKMDHAKLWLAHPFYSLITQTIYDDGSTYWTNNDGRTVVSVLRKKVS